MRLHIMPPRALVAWATLFVVLAYSSAANRAQAQPSNDEVQAETFLERGLALRRQGRLDEAIEAFRQARELNPSGQTYGQLALAYQEQGRFEDAEENLEAAFEHEDEWVQRYEVELRSALEYVRGQLRESAPAPSLALPISIASTGTALLVTSLATYVAADHAFDEHNQCIRDTDTACSRSRARRLKRTSIATLSAGGLITAAGLTWLGLALARGSESPSENALRCLPGLASLACTLSF